MNERAASQFLVNIENCKDRLDVIRATVDDFMGFGPDEIDWGHVGDVGHVEEMLDQIVQFLQGEDD